MELLVAGVAVDLKACVQLEKDASTTLSESPWAQDMSADMVVSQAPIQSEELVPPRSVARRQLSLSYYHTLSRILSAAEAAQARLYRELDLEQQTNHAECGRTGQQILIRGAAHVCHGYPPNRPTENSSCAADRYARCWTAGDMRSAKGRRRSVL